MIQLVKTENGFILSGHKNNKVELRDNLVKINDEIINSVGEYEVGGVEIVYANSALLIIWQSIHLFYVFRDNLLSQFEKDQFASTQVVILSPKLIIGSKNYAELEKNLQPAMVIASSQEQTKSLPIAHWNEINSLKLSANSLPIGEINYLYWR